MGRVLINDTTLRDGEQSPGVAVQASEKIAIAEALYAAGIEAMEVGTPAMGEEECARIRQVRRQLPGATLMTWCRMQAGEIRQSADLGMDWVDISIPASDKLRQYKLREGLPLLLGRGYRLVLGKHSGRQAVNGVFDRMGYHLTSAQIDQLLPALRRFAENGKRSPRDDELAAIYHALCSAETLQARG